MEFWIEIWRYRMGMHYHRSCSRWPLLTSLVIVPTILATVLVPLVDCCTGFPPLLRRRRNQRQYTSKLILYLRTPSYSRKHKRIFRKPRFCPLFSIGWLFIRVCHNLVLKSVNRTYDIYSISVQTLSSKNCKESSVKEYQEYHVRKAKKKSPRLMMASSHLRFPRDMI